MRTSKPITARLWPKIRKTDGCWIWLASRTAAGYGQINSGARGGTMLYAHRLVYELLVGPIPLGMELDHTCRNRACCNPDHLEPVTHAVNVQRGIAGQVNRDRQLAKTTCPKGHPLSGENLYVDPRGSRGCRACRCESSERSKGRAAAESR